MTIDMGKEFGELSYAKVHGEGQNESGKATKRRDTGKAALKHDVQNCLKPMTLLT